MDKVLKGNIEKVICERIKELDKHSYGYIYYDPNNHDVYGYAEDETKIPEGFIQEDLSRLIKEKSIEDVENVYGPIEDMYELDEKAIDAFINSSLCIGV